ncbi:6,7-dimethyl-8-ribityllumazine synthase [Thermosporothrix hazakensis]|jgi:6,7-dimethyl-8-ribityllumazine synthase|uniref:6,7-dimethyl-8-ribityllumazine synthase n=1 Tax=Thermosporothrix hazakensis TaxID=644383 RepID=A0A326U837_THEHA|nr:6,7-dimethyl-8-ribityllumazine synthase [Thermosporothrix hazakensis]PZW29449.1 6,7-dimethyl-8-ribityllumazine synthase [Thermosporothrix hazakensis]GCE45835.1 6,7-dimethyl-8-ribityllumazine synthase [Thermosporothrix hazakensis]
MKHMLPPTPDKNGSGLSIGILVARYNWPITGATLALTCEELQRLGVAEHAITIHSVPGSFELPLLAQTMLQSKRYDALICIGCVMKGETRHDVIVSDATAQGLMRLALDYQRPVILGVMCAETQAQAEARIERGIEYARAAVEMARAQQHLLHNK